MKRSLELTGPICIALDSADPAQVRKWAATTRAEADVFKIGLTALATGGGAIVEEIARMRPVFVDAKLHDIPAQVAGAVDAYASTGASLLTVHSLGGSEMMAAAVKAAGDVAILAVTVLTSLDDGDLEAFGFTDQSANTVARLAELALDAGVEGLVCSPREVAALRERFGPRSSGGPLLVVPGIRWDDAVAGDQRRTGDPTSTLRAGADLLVIGRPVTAAPDPTAAAAALRTLVVQ